MPGSIEASESGDNAEGVGGLGIDLALERLHVLRLLDKAEDLAIFSRVRDRDRIALRIQSARALTYVAATRANIVKDLALDDLSRRLEKIEGIIVKKHEDY